MRNFIKIIGLSIIISSQILAAPVATKVVPAQKETAATVSAAFPLMRLAFFGLQVFGIAKVYQAFAGNRRAMARQPLDTDELTQKVQAGLMNGQHALKILTDDMDKMLADDSQIVKHFTTGLILSLTGIVGYIFAS